MSIMPNRSAEQPTHPNQEAIDGLRQAIAFLEQHPEVPVNFATVFVEVPHNDHARIVLSELAVALGEKATERTSAISQQVVIEGYFDGRVSVRAAASVKQLGGGPQPRPDYRPILPECPSCHGSQSTPDGQDRCTECDGAGHLLPDLEFERAFSPEVVRRAFRETTAS